MVKVVHFVMHILLGFRKRMSCCISQEFPPPTSIFPSIKACLLTLAPEALCGMHCPLIPMFTHVHTHAHLHVYTHVNTHLHVVLCPHMRAHVHPLLSLQSQLPPRSLSLPSPPSSDHTGISLSTFFSSGPSPQTLTSSAQPC